MQHSTIRVGDGAELHVTESGAGAPLVLVPGWSQSAAAFRHQIEAFSQDRRVIALDMRGHGASVPPPIGYRIQRLAKDLHDVLAALDLDRPDVMGHSMGCSVIWSYLSLFEAERPLGRLLLVDQAPAVLAQPGWDETTRANAGCLFPDMTALADFEAAVRGATTAAATKELIRGMFTSAIAEAELDWIARENVKLPRDLAARLLHDHSVLDWRPQIAAIRNRTLVVGAEASIFSVQSQRWIADRIPGAELAILEAEAGGSHFMFLENPEWFNARVAAFLAG
ncbi:alpha/beta hydrolase [Stappia sp.]|uniref:alpha/beta fold hydrolase n=1 Tax=Stappia sp. TaxID=1870903 RepID=UPI0032D8DEF9